MQWLYFKWILFYLFHCFSLTFGPLLLLLILIILCDVFYQKLLHLLSISEEVESMDVDPSPAATESPDPDKTSEKV